MAKSNGFQFKQFFIAHSQCAMKVNTDGILLGAVANVENKKRILDLGTGSGLIAIMLAQRTACDTEIVGVELDPDAFQQAQQNALDCPWNNRIVLLQADVLQTNFANTFDLIVSNPPYFEHSPASRNAQRDLARAITQSHLDWLKQAKKWLSSQGQISLILPSENAHKLIEQARSIELFCTEKWLVCTKTGKEPKRIIVTFEQSEKSCTEKSIEIYQNDNQYSAQFKQLTKDFYLNF